MCDKSISTRHYFAARDNVSKMQQNYNIVWLISLNGIQRNVIKLMAKLMAIESKAQLK